MIIGMDFGTTNSGMAVFDGENINFIPLDPANANPAVARTALYITNDRTAYLGRDSIDTYYEENLNRPFKLERVRVGEIEVTFAEIGTFIHDVYIDKDVYAPGRLFLSFKMGLSSEKYLGTVVGSYYFFLEDIIALYLYITRKRAQEHLQTELDSIVLGRPVRYSNNETQNKLAQERLLQAAFRAGYSNVYLQYEPIAAAYHYERSIHSEQNILIFDFGGGTLDMSVLRVGNPKTRQVLSTGGVPIAGDVFDSKIVRSKIPQHFGEGDTYRHNGEDYPIPNRFFEAFSNWQDLLSLQLPDELATLKRIRDTAKSPRKIRGLINLISSQYGLKIFDIAEQAKRKVSIQNRTQVKIIGDGFSVFESLSRSEFERIIRTDVEIIADALDQVISDAGLTTDQIDSVIRTGGSSQIPAFIEMLESRFGADKVRELDAFSSVTAGLGIIANQIEEGHIDLPCYTPETNPPADYLNTKKQGGITVIQLDLMKQFIDMRENQQQTGDTALALVTQTASQKLRTLRIMRKQFESEIMPDADITLNAPLNIISQSQRALLITSEYRCFLKSVQQLADLDENGLDVAEIEEFRRDEFGAETVCAIHAWDSLQDAHMILMMSTLGYGRLFAGATLLDNIDKPISYQLLRSRGYPMALVKLQHDDELFVMNHAGRALRMPFKALSHMEQRIMSVPLRGGIISTFAQHGTCELIAATASSYATRIPSSVIPVTSEMNTTGHKILERANPVALIPFQTDKMLWAVTTQRMIPIEPDTIPQDYAPRTDYKLARLRKGEQLISLLQLPEAATH